MSIKIRQAFLIKDMKMSKLKSLLDVLRMDIEKIALKRYNDFIANIVGEDQTSNSKAIKIARANREWMLRREKIDFENFNDPFVDISCEIIFIPVKNKETDYLMGFVFTKQKEMYQKILEIEGAMEYFFDNQSDKPECFSDEDWKKKEDFANQISSDIITRQGFSIEIISKKTVFPYF